MGNNAGGAAGEPQRTNSTRGLLDCDTVALDDAQSALVIIDQTLLPNEYKRLSLTEPSAFREAIVRLRVRGAPAIGVAAAFGLYLAAKRIDTDDMTAFWRLLTTEKEALASARPTAVNLFWALARMEQAALSVRHLSVEAVKDALREEALRIRDEDVRVCERIGEQGLRLLRDGDGILTHCNAGQLAAVRYGTALAPLYLGHKRGYRFRVFADETRPLLQGARLTAFELYAAGIDTTVICDNMASRVMKNGWVQAVMVGADRIAANGDVCNKIGTSGLAILARHYGIPFYVCAPVSTIDGETASGGEIPVEERGAREITSLWYKETMVPNGVKIYNPCFDVTDNELVSAIVTEHGVVSPPYTENLAAVLAAAPSGSALLSERSAEHYHA